MFVFLFVLLLYFAEQLTTIKQSTLAKIICDNGDDFPRVHRRVMEPTSDR